MRLLDIKDCTDGQEWMEQRSKIYNWCGVTKTYEVFDWLSLHMDMQQGQDFRDCHIKILDLDDYTIPLAVYQTPEGPLTGIFGDTEISPAIKRWTTYIQQHHMDLFYTMEVPEHHIMIDKENWNQHVASLTKVNRCVKRGKHLNKDWEVPLNQTQYIKYHQILRHYVDHHNMDWSPQQTYKGIAANPYTSFFRLISPASEMGIHPEKMERVVGLNQYIAETHDRGLTIRSINKFFSRDEHDKSIGLGNLLNMYLIKMMYNTRNLLRDYLGEVSYLTFSVNIGMDNGAYKDNWNTKIIPITLPYLKEL
jgi:hypothetical protein